MANNPTLYCPACMAREALANIERYRDTRDGWVYEALGSVEAMLERIHDKSWTLCPEHRRARRLARKVEHDALEAQMSADQTAWERTHKP